MYASHLFVSSVFFFFNDTATTEIYTLSLHDALPISRATAPRWACRRRPMPPCSSCPRRRPPSRWRATASCTATRSEEHTSELQSQSNHVCRLLLEKKNTSSDTQLRFINTERATCML